jgi:hypothetical protein
VARILEVGEHEGTVYAVGAAYEGVEVARIVGDPARRATLSPHLAPALVLPVARFVRALHEHADVWAVENGLSTLFPMGLRADALVIGGDGELRVRALAGAALDARPIGRRAPELERGRPHASTDVWALGQLLRALLPLPGEGRVDPALSKLLGAMIAEDPDDRCDVSVVIERLEKLVSPPDALRAIAELVARAPPMLHEEGVPKVVVDGVRARLATLAIHRSHPPDLDLPIDISLDDDDVRTAPTEVHRFFKPRDTQVLDSQVDGVFTREAELDDGHTAPTEIPSFLPAMNLASTAAGNAVRDDDLSFVEGNDVASVAAASAEGENREFAEFDDEDVTATHPIDTSKLVTTHDGQGLIRKPNASRPRTP